MIPGVDVAPVLTVAREVGDRAVGFAKDATYTAIGLGVMGVMKAHQRRREIERALRR